MPKMVKYDSKPITIRFPKEVLKAIEDRVKDKKKKFGSYKEADFLRTAAVKLLKDKGYLDKKKDYL